MSSKVFLFSGFPVKIMGALLGVAQACSPNPSYKSRPLDQEL
jgi:hypothetical protein